MQILPASPCSQQSEIIGWKVKEEDCWHRFDNNSISSAQGQSQGVAVLRGLSHMPKFSTGAAAVEGGFELVGCLQKSDNDWILIVAES